VGRDGSKVRLVLLVVAEAAALLGIVLAFCAAVIVIWGARE
jgi:hypothetical protein